VKLRLPKLDPDTAYIGASLFLPRALVVEAPIRTALTFGVEAGEEPREMVRPHPAHIEVPRNYLTRDGLRRLGIERVVDLRPRSYPASSLRPRAEFAFREHQLPAWRALVAAAGAGRDGVLRLDTGRGKTVMGLRYACEVGGPLLVVSAQEAHLKSWERELRQWFHLDGDVGWIAGPRMEYRREVVFSTIQTLVKRFEAGDLPLDFHMRFALTIYDEVHHQAAEWFARGSDLTSGRRLGLTATLKRRDRCEGVVLYQIGPVLYDDPSEDALVPTVQLHETGTELDDDDPRILDVNGQPNMAKLRTTLGTLPRRNRKIMDVVGMRLGQGRKVYLVSHSKDHVHELARCAEDRGWARGVITGDEKNADERLRQLNSHDLVIATLAVGKENYNRPDLSCLVLATPMAVDEYAPTEFVQVTGRTTRPLPGKPDPVVDLLVDRGVGPSFGMLQTALKWCRAQGWAIRGDEWNASKKAQTARTWRVSPGSSGSGRGSTTTPGRSTGKR